MTVIRMLDEALVAFDAGLWLDLHATPSAWLLAVGLVAVGALLAAATTACAARMLVVLPTARPVLPARDHDRERLRPRRKQARRAVAIQGPRAPGRGIVPSLALR